MSELTPISLVHARTTLSILFVISTLGQPELFGSESSWPAEVLGQRKCTFKAREP